MKKLLIISALSLCLFSCIDKTAEDKDDTEKKETVNTLTDDEKKDGWQLLFNGTDTKGWHKYGDTVVRSAWRVDSGMLHLVSGEMEKWQTKGGGDIVTDSSFDNFHLKADWKIDTCGNSGIIFLSHEDTVKYTWSWQTGMEMQVLDNKCHPDTAYKTHRAGSLYDLIEVSKVTVKPALEWNHAEIKHVNGKLDMWLNDSLVVSTTIGDDNWKKMLAGSKWKDHPDFSTYKKGKIGLQDHGNNVWFRNIKIKKL
jgi:hypothetical protein